jgi:hypothetical protein
VSGIADAQQSRPIPLRQAVDCDREEFHIIPAFQLVDPFRQPRRQREDHATKILDIALHQFVGRAFRDDVGALPIIATQVSELDAISQNGH